MEHSDLDRYLPLTEPAYYIMLALVEPSHGYAIMQHTEELSEGMIRIGPGTLYGVLAYLEKENLIIKVKEEKRRKVYTLSLMGKKVLEHQINRYEVMFRRGSHLLRQDETELEEA
jgi:DNA-binding PadR family transcriptional regulator